MISFLYQSKFASVLGVVAHLYRKYLEQISLEIAESLKFVEKIDLNGLSQHYNLPIDLLTKVFYHYCFFLSIIFAVDH